MPHRALDSRHPVESCAIQLHSWRPFQLQSTPKTLDPDSYCPKPYSKTSNSNGGGAGGVYSKRPCLADRTTSFSLDCIDMSKLSLFDDDRPFAAADKRGTLRWVARKRRRRGSRSVSGRSSDRSGTRRCCSVGASAAYATCSDFPVAAGPGTDSSGELFVNGDANWGMDVSEGKSSLRRDKDGERENLGSGCGQIGNFDALGNDSGYGSEPGYRGDAEIGYGDEVEEEEDDARLLLWDSNMGMTGEDTFSEQKVHHRGRRKKQDWKLFDPMR